MINRHAGKTLIHIRVNKFLKNKANYKDRLKNEEGYPRHVLSFVLLRISCIPRQDTCYRDEDDLDLLVLLLYFLRSVPPHPVYAMIRTDARLCAF
jgi:hypothetical protein